eukprot:scaffold138869_cov19-Tisochrysis_lutea.AAC.1
MTPCSGTDRDTHTHTHESSTVSDCMVTWADQHAEAHSKGWFLQGSSFVCNTTLAICLHLFTSALGDKGGALQAMRKIGQAHACVSPAIHSHAPRAHNSSKADHNRGLTLSARTNCAFASAVLPTSRYTRPSRYRPAAPWGTCTDERVVGSGPMALISFREHGNLLQSHEGMRNKLFLVQGTPAIASSEGVKGGRRHFWNSNAVTVPASGHGEQTILFWKDSTRLQ